MSATRQVFRPLLGIVLALSTTVAVSAQATDPPSAALIDDSGTHGISPPDKILVTNTKRLDLDTGVATVPIFRGMANGTPVWFIITDVSDEAMAHEAGVNFAPRLRNIRVHCPGCAMTVQSGDPVLGRAEVLFPARPDFSPTRTVEPGPDGFPPLLAQPGAVAMPGYSDFVQIDGTDVVWNAPIIAIGDGPFDVTEHANTHDRVARVDTGAREADLLIVRAFAGGMHITYHSFSASDPLTAALERATFIPALGGTCCVGGSLHPGGVRTAIFGFVNGLRGNTPESQGLRHLIGDGLSPHTATPDDQALREALRRFGDLRNVLDVMTTYADPKEAQGYTPLWDLHLGEWSPAAVAAGQNTARADANEIRNLVAQGLITGPGGAPFGPANIVINCPQLSFLDDQPPTANTALLPIARRADDGNQLVDQPLEVATAFLQRFGDLGAANSAWVDQHNAELEDGQP